MVTATEVFVAVNEAINAHDYDAVYAHMDPGHRQYLNGALAADGLDATRAMDETFYATLPDLQRVTHEIFGTEDRAACRSTFTGTMPDGRRVELPCGSMLYLRDGRINESWVYMDLTPLGS